MENFLDYDDKKIKQGFYNHYECDILFYFTGKYDIRSPDIRD